MTTKTQNQKISKFVLIFLAALFSVSYPTYALCYAFLPISSFCLACYAYTLLACLRTNMTVINQIKSDRHLGE